MQGERKRKKRKALEAVQTVTKGHRTNPHSPDSGILDKLAAGQRSLESPCGRRRYQDRKENSSFQRMKSRKPKWEQEALFPSRPVQSCTVGQVGLGMSAASEVVPAN